MNTNLRKLGGVLLWAALASSTSAHEGHDHAAAPLPAASTADRAERLADGAIFVPKPAQREMELRTLVAEPASARRTLPLNGRVIADPRAAGRIQAPWAGHLEAPPGGWPLAGQPVRAGQVLAMLVANPAPQERAAQLAQAGEAAPQLAAARARAARLAELEGSVPKKDIEAAQADVAALEARLAAAKSALSARAPLTAPLAGRIADVRVVPGQQVDARDTLFEIADPQRLAIEATAYTPLAPAELAAATADISGAGQFRLQPIAAALALREQAQMLNFAVVDGARERLLIGQPARVLLETGKALDVVLLPPAALVRRPDGQTVAYVHSAAERYDERVVESFEAGAKVAVTKGIWPGERVVVQGAAALVQVR
ncbi:MAG: efflux RND transporter periplasmic adaptor subunit [Rhodocyclaceae bacterium]|nr:efflux RND transporter periplasmic adaptor subunit [Rhodocyclaceae bacterium]